MKLIIAGSRTIKDYSRVEEIIYEGIESLGLYGKITEIVSGRAYGVDRLGERWAQENGIPVTEMPADWNDLTHPDAVIRYGYGKAYDANAGRRRNEDMAKYADAVIVIWDGKSTGTQNMYELAKKYNLPVHLDTTIQITPVLKQEKVYKPVLKHSRDRHVDWAKEILSTDAVVIDTESSGGSFDDEVINVGIVRVADGKILMDKLIRPVQDIKFNYYASLVHGITKEDLIDAATMPELKEEIHEILHNKTVLAYNITADKRMLKQTFDKYKLDFPLINWHCLMKTYKEYRNPSVAVRLSQACKEMNVKAGNHQAIEDALATARLCHRIAQNYEPLL